uniref:Small ribosomal subunit protein uS19m n=1 Tax=Malawimonas californiana TaxID=221722 RepID=A0A0B5GFU9_MALCL|nr:ribosomal protein S19 [Malawimonas californiana]AJF22887.1 ribosomal protein S19 [Malawimonas californiana]
MNRSIWKKSFIDNSLIKTLNNIPKNLKIYSRRSTIYPQFLNNTVNIYNGQKFIQIKITNEMIGHKFGEFALTRVPHQYKVKNKKKKK